MNNSLCPSTMKVCEKGPQHCSTVCYLMQPEPSKFTIQDFFGEIERIMKEEPELLGISKPSK